MNSLEPTILIADHSPPISEFVKAVLEVDGYSVRVVNSCEQALQQGTLLKPHMLIIDPVMPGISGVEVATRLSRETKCKVLFLTAWADDDDFREMVRGLLKQGCDAGVLSKPCEKQQLLDHVHRKIGVPHTNTPEGSGDGQTVAGGTVGQRKSNPSVQEQEIGAKREGQEVAEVSPKLAPVIDLMEALKKSIAEEQQQPVGTYEGLLEVATLKLYQTNAFRITGLDVDSSLREVSKEAEKLEMMIKLGRTPASGGIFPLSETPTVESVKKALQSLKDPESRLVQELFWFWPCSGVCKDDFALQALRERKYQTAVDHWTKIKGQWNGIAIHNLAVFHHLGALDAAVRRSKTREAAPTEEIYLWSSAYRYWKALLDRTEFWDAFIGRIRTINDPRLTVEMSRSIRATLPNAVVGINAQQAVIAAERGDFEEAAKHLKLMHTSAFGEAPAVQETRRALSHAQEHLERLCENAEKNARSNPKEANTVARRLLDDKSKLLRTFNYLLGVGDPMCDAAHDRVAEAARFCTVQYVNETSDWERTRPVLEECLALSEGKALRLKLEEDLETVAQKEIVRFCDDATKEAKANPRRANLVARKLLDGKATLQNAFNTLLSIGEPGYDAAHDSLVAAARSCMIDYVNETEDWEAGRSFTEECLALAKGEALRSQLKEDLELIRRNLIGGKQSQASRQSRTMSGAGATARAGAAIPTPAVKWWSKDKLIPISMFGVLILFAAMKGCDDSNGPVHSAPSPSTTQAATPDSTPQTSPRSTDDSTQSRSIPSPGSTLDRAELKAEIDSDEATLNALEAECKADHSRVDEYDALLDVDKNLLDRMQRDHDAGLDVDTDLYESTRHRYNANVNEHNQTVDKYNAKLAQYKQFLAATNEKIDRYNSLGGTR